LLGVGTHSVRLSDRLLASTGSLKLAVGGALAWPNRCLTSLLLPHVTQYRVILGHIQTLITCFERQAAQVLIIVILIFINS
jgi:hypothetical protein